MTELHFTEPYNTSVLSEFYSYMVNDIAGNTFKHYQFNRFIDKKITEMEKDRAEAVFVSGALTEEPSDSDGNDKIRWHWHYSNDFTAYTSFMPNDKNGYSMDYASQDKYLLISHLDNPDRIGANGVKISSKDAGNLGVFLTSGSLSGCTYGVLFDKEGNIYQIHAGASNATADNEQIRKIRRRQKLSSFYEAVYLLMKSVFPKEQDKCVDDISQLMNKLDELELKGDVIHSLNDACCVTGSTFDDRRELSTYTYHNLYFGDHIFACHNLSSPDPFYVSIARTCEQTGTLQKMERVLGGRIKAYCGK